MSTILIADDEASIRTIVSKTLEKKGYMVLKAQSGDEALSFLKQHPIDVALIDIRMPGVSGLDILNHQKEFLSKPNIFIITAQDVMENAVEAMKRGAYDYLTKPFDLDELSILVDRALKTRQLESEVMRLRQEVTSSPYLKPTIIGKSKVIQDVYKAIGKVANQDITILLEGESGTGKELVARAIHEQGVRASHPFIAVNCSAIPTNLLESELFGYKKGAYTGALTDKAGYFEMADRGSLFLDEIGDMPLSLQSKLLRVLQEKEIQRLGDTRIISVDVRIIAATNQDLESLVKKGKFREDLFFRLNVVPLKLPPLRKRKSDIPLLIDYFLKKISFDFKLPPKQISPKAIDYLVDREWLGNIRELENLIKRVCVLSQNQVISLEDIESVATNLREEDIRINSSDLHSIEEIIEQQLTINLVSNNLKKDVYEHFLPLLERPLIRLALKKVKGNQIKASEFLGINRNTLRKKIKELRIERRGLVK